MSKKKLPAFLFYPGDWRKDPGVQSMDYEERGVWHELLCIMHESENRGMLTLGNLPVDNLRISLWITPVSPDYWEFLRKKRENFFKIFQNSTFFKCAP